MKKSNIILLSFISFLFLSAFAIHAGLDAQFKKGRFTELNRQPQNDGATGFNEVLLTAAFSKVVINGVAFRSGEEHNNFRVVYDSASKNILYVDKRHPENTTYRVQNDTLYLDLKIEGMDQPAKLTCNNLQYIRSAVPAVLITRSALDQLSISSSTGFFIEEDIQCKQLSVYLTGNGYFNLNNNKGVDGLSLNLQGQSTFESDNSAFHLKEASFGDSATVNLKGTSLHHFNQKIP